MVISLEQRPKFDGYVDSYVAFVDILGFTNLVREIQGEEDFEDVSWLMYQMKSLAEAYSKAEDIFELLNVTSVSDCMIFSIPYTAPGASTLLITMLHHIQYNFVGSPQKVLLRGYVARGQVYHRDGMLFGTGYLDAYHGECLRKGPPRIVIDSKIVESARATIAAEESTEGKVSRFRYLRQDEDGATYIDYLNPIGAVANIPKAKLVTERDSIREFARNGIEQFRDNPGIRPKYEWLLNRCDSNPTLSSDE